MSLERIIILALSGIGDALMVTPALRLLRERLPKAQIDVMVMMRGAEEIFRRNPNVSNVVFFEFLREGYWKSLSFLASVRGRYDASINVYPSNRIEYNLVNYVVHAPVRAGVRYLRRDILNLGFLNTLRIVENDSLHNVQENIRLVAELLRTDFNEEPGLEFHLTDDDLQAADRMLTEQGIQDGDLVVGLHPGCATLKNHSKRRWEPEKFAELARMMTFHHGAKVLIFGGPDEDDLKRLVCTQAGLPSTAVVALQSLAHSAALMRRCNCFVTNDSSLMHVAAAMKLPTVAIIGPTNPNYIHPWKTDHRIVSLHLECSPCFYYSPRPLICGRTDVKFKCIKELDVHRVYDSVRELLSTKG
jgi:heptosyltransferase-2